MSDTKIVINPSEKQRLFMLSKKKVCVYGGARGGGKSWVVRQKAVGLCLHYPGIKCLIVRRTYPELVVNHINDLKVMTLGFAKYNDKDKVFKFNNGSSILLRYCAKDDDLMSLQGAEFDAIFIDEAANLTEYQIKAIMACLRGVNGIRKRMYLTCNPGGRGHGYIKRLKERKFLPDEDPDDYEFIQALVTDNHVLMETQPDYIKQLEALPPKLRAAWLEGSFDQFEGAFFEEFRDDPSHYEDRRWTHVIPGFDPPRGWKIYRSYDWGYNHPFSCAWYALDYDGVLYRILELYGCRKNEANVGVHWTDEKQFSEIARIEREHPWLKGKKIEGVADPSIWSAAKTGLSTADTAMKHRVFFEKANNDRIAGWNQCRYRMAFSAEGYPMFYCFDNCEAFRRTIPILQYDKNVPEDLDTDDEDHVADDWRYMCMSHVIKPRINKEENIPVYDPLNQFKKKNY